MNHFAQIAARLGELDAMLLTGESNCFYATGFKGEGAALVTKDKSWYFTDSRYTEAAQKAIGNAAVIEQISAARPFTVCINDALAEVHAEKVGFEEQIMAVAEYGGYKEKLHCTLQGASALMTALRQSKDVEEIECLVAAQRIAERALRKILTEIRPGVTEKEIAARLQYLMLSYGAEKMSFDPIVASGPNGSMPHAVPTERKIQKGDFVTMDFGCVYRGYCSDMTRTVAVGEPTEEMRRVYDTVLRAQTAGIAAARAGVTGRAIDGAARDVITEAGYGAYFGHSFGHSVGIDIHESPNASPSNDQPMPVGTVVSAEPGIYLAGRFGVRIEDVIILTEAGARDITEADRSLIIL